MDKVLTPSDKATELKDAVDTLTDTREGLTLTLTQPPELLLKDGRVIGIGVWVRLDGPKGELPIDPHRRFYNPPVVHEGKRDPESALWQMLWDSVELQPAPTNWKTAGTVDTFYSSTGDGFVQSFDPTYATANAGRTFSVNTSDQSLLIGQYTGFYCDCSFVAFDTSSIDDVSSVSAITLSIYGYNDSSATNFTINARDYDWGLVLDSGDWLGGAGAGAKTLLASFATATPWNTSGYNVFTSEAAFLTATNLKTGIVHIALTSNRFESVTQPAGDEYVGGLSSGVAGTTQDPKLTVTHTVVPTGTIVSTFPKPTASAVGALTGVNPSGVLVATFPRVTCAATGTVPPFVRSGFGIPTRSLPRIYGGG